MVAKLFRALRIDAIVEPTRLFTDAAEDACNQRPDIFLRNPRGLDRQIIIDVAVTGIDGQSRTSDEAVERPLQERYDQKMTKYGPIKEFTDDDDGVRRVITDVVFSHEDDVYYAKYIIKGEKDIKKNNDYTILRQVFDMAREGGDDWVEDRFYKGKKIE